MKHGASLSDVFLNRSVAQEHSTSLLLEHFVLSLSICTVQKQIYFFVCLFHQNRTLFPQEQESQDVVVGVVAVFLSAVSRCPLSIYLERPLNFRLSGQLTFRPRPGLQHHGYTHLASAPLSTNVMLILHLNDLDMQCIQKKAGHKYKACYFQQLNNI